MLLDSSVYDDLTNVQQVLLSSVSKPQPSPGENSEDELLFDAAYFSGSISLIPDPPTALRAAAKMVKPGGKVYVTQTYQRLAPPGSGVLKPLLKHLTTIDFGALVSEEDILRILRDSGLKVEEHCVIPGSIDHAMQVARLSVLAVSAP